MLLASDHFVLQKNDTMQILMRHICSGIIFRPAINVNGLCFVASVTANIVLLLLFFA